MRPRTRLDHHGTEREVVDEVAVHDVEVNGVDAGIGCAGNSSPSAPKSALRMLALICVAGATRHGRTELGAARPRAQGRPAS